MLTKQKSKAIYQLKYILLVPLVFGMLVYSSCENETKQDIVSSELDFNEILVQVKDLDDKKSWDKEWDKMLTLPGRNCLIIKDKKDFQRHYFIDGNGIYSEDSRFLEKAITRIEYVDYPPIFPGCENRDDLRFCFESSIREHFQKNLQYPDGEKDAASRGSVAVQIVIDKNGKILDFQRMGTDNHFISEVDRLIALLPKMEPAKLGDKTVQMMYIFPVVFNIGGGNIRQENGMVPFAVIDEAPIFPGCEEAADKKACFQEKMQEHIRKNFNYPQLAQEMGIKGRVSVMFTIDELGNIANIRKRGPHELLENETERIIECLPKMTPGKQGGETVKVPFSIPVTFRLESGIDAEIAKFSDRDANWLPFESVDIAPIFPGCENATDSKSCFQEKMIAHVKKHFNYPKEAQEKGVQGRVAIMFTIDANGHISNIKKRGPNPLLENEAERIVKRLPKMKPAMDNGQIAEVVYSIPITFKLK